MTRALTHLTFQRHRCAEAVEFYAATVPGASITARTSLSPEQEVIEFTLAGHDFMAADSPMRHQWDFTPAVSVFLLCDTTPQVDDVFTALSRDGRVYMPIADYGFNPHFGWCEDRFGVSWQIGLDTQAGTETGVEATGNP